MTQSPFHAYWLRLVGASEWGQTLSSRCLLPWGQQGEGAFLWQKPGSVAGPLEGQQVHTASEKSHGPLEGQGERGN